MENLNENIGQLNEASDLTVGEKLNEDFKAAIIAVLGDNADKQFIKGSISTEDLQEICLKVQFYLDL